MKGKTVLPAAVMLAAALMCSCSSEDKEQDIVVISAADATSSVSQAVQDNVVNINGADYTLDTEEIFLTDVTPSDTENLKKLENLKYISVETENTANLSGFSELKNITVLSISGSFGSLDFIDGMDSLGELYLAFAEPGVFTDIPENNTVTVLQIDYSEIPDMSCLGAFKALRSLGMVETSYSGIEAMPEMPSVETLDIELDSSSAADFGLLKKMPGLKSFTFSNFYYDNYPVNTGDITSCTQLEELYIYSDLDDLEFCRELKNLRIFSLYGDESYDITPLCECEKAEEIYLSCGYSEDDLESLKYALPDCEIVTDTE